MGGFIYNVEVERYFKDNNLKNVDETILEQEAL